MSRVELRELTNKVAFDWAEPWVEDYPLVDKLGDVASGGSVKGGFAHQHFEEEDAQAIDVVGLAVLLHRQHFRGHVLIASADAAHLSVVELPREAKIG